MGLKLHIMSDLHLEFGPYIVPETDADVVILAGDIWLGTKGIEWALENIQKPIVMVLGNHDYWGYNLKKVLVDAKMLTEGTRIKLLDGDTCRIKGVQFVGGTLWTDYKLYGEANAVHARIRAQNCMRDFEKIKIGELDQSEKRRITPLDLISIHEVQRQAIVDALSEDIPTVVVTHHAPHGKSISPDYRDDDSNPAYASDMTALLTHTKHPPKLWVHGHIHARNDYMLGETRVVSNPRGYSGYRETPGFDPQLVIEVPNE